jgi:putative intracellular protease/amidase
MIVANPATSPVTGWPIGFWAAELTHPWLDFVKAGYTVELASLQGGKPSSTATAIPATRADIRPTTS